MTVESTVQEMFDKYPILFSTREECFDHLFCTIGNGDKWKWGQLIYQEPHEEGYDEEEDRLFHEADYSKEHPKATQSKKNLEERRKLDELYLKDGIIKKIGEHEWYPLSRKYSRIFHVPDDARDDWKAAVEECKRMLEKDGVDWKNATGY